MCFQKYASHNQVSVLETESLHRRGDVRTDRNKTKTLTGNNDSYTRTPRLPQTCFMASGSHVLTYKMGVI